LLALLSRQSSLLAGMVGGIAWRRQQVPRIPGGIDWHLAGRSPVCWTARPSTSSALAVAF